MAVTSDEVEELRRVAAERTDLGTCQPLDNISEIIGYSVALCRAENIDEADGVEMLCRAARLERADLLRAEHILRLLGYRQVADRLKLLAKRKRLT
jgi:hypothetical protein